MNADRIKHQIIALLALCDYQMLRIVKCVVNKLIECKEDKRERGE